MRSRPKPSAATQAREARAQASHRLASEIDDAIDHGVVCVSTARYRGDRRMTTADRDWEADHVIVKVEIPLPSSDPLRVREIALALAAALRSVGIK